jgi:hypothetical protein
MFRIYIYACVADESVNCYFGCEEINVRGNFPAIFDVRIFWVSPAGPEFTYLDVYWDGSNQIEPTPLPLPGTGWKSLKFCFLARNPKNIIWEPGVQVHVANVMISVRVPDEGGVVELKECWKTKAVLYPLQCTIDVDIDIKPGSDPNPINQGSNGLVPVAILSSDVFDATQVDPISVSLAGATVAVRGKGQPLAHVEDVDGDGLLDLVVQVETTGFDDLGTGGIVELTGKNLSGEDIIGYDDLVIVPPK